MWSISKSVSELNNELEEIDKELNIIRWRCKSFFANAPNIFRITHEYSDSIKGFILWKDTFESYSF